VAQVEAIAQTSPVPVRLVRMPENRGLSASFNLGVRRAASDIVVLMHSDASLPSTRELDLLVAPLLSEPGTVATYSHNLMPHALWATYPFWQRVLFARSVDKEPGTFSCKFVAIRRAVFLGIGGMDEVLFRPGVGGEDADLQMRLAREGRVAVTDARVTHLHAIGTSFGLRDYVAQRKLLARAYGCVLFLYGAELPSWWPLLVKPLLAPLPFLPHLHLAGIGLLLLFSALYSWKTYANQVKRREIGALLLPLVDIGMVYHEVFWMAEGWLSTWRAVRRQQRG